MRNLKQQYILLASLALLACVLSYYRSNISSPMFPPLLTSKLNALNSSNSTILSKSFQLAENTSDRKLSSVTRYTFPDGSRLFAVMVRVRKRDDFKIETYGLLTKGLDLIHIKSPLFSNTVPYSMVGLIKGIKTLQTCVVPGTTDLEQVNVQLFPLQSQADRLAGNTQSFFSKLLGTDDRSDYSCLVLTYQPNSDTAKNAWIEIIRAAQMSMLSSTSSL